MAKDWKAYLGAKIFVGISCGFLGTTCMTYLSEIVMPQMRGSVLAAFSFSWQIGSLAAALGLQILVTVSVRCRLFLCAIDPLFRPHRWRTNTPSIQSLPLSGYGE